MPVKNKINLIRVFLRINGVFLLFWWPLSHWFYSDFYHRLMGFQPGSYQDSFVKVIGVSGLLPVLLLFTAAKNPLKYREIIMIVIISSLAIAGAFLYLIARGGFPKNEYFNVGLSLVSALFLITFYPWKNK